jgi:hypothetical protein
MKSIFLMLVTTTVLLAEPIQPPTHGGARLDPGRPEFYDPNVGSDLKKMAADIQDLVKRREGNLTQEERYRLARSLSYAQALLNQKQDIPQFKYTLEGEYLSVTDITGKKVTGWNNHKSMEIRGDVIALLDKNKEFAAYKANGTALVNGWRDVKQYVITPTYIGLLDNTGEFEAFSTKESKKLIADWRDTVSVIAKDHYIALLDKKGDLNGYSADGTRLLKVSGVTKVQALDESTIQYTLKTGETNTFQLAQ